jgi:hypothetical protein
MRKRRRFVVDEYIAGKWARMHDLGVMTRKDAKAWQLRLSDRGRPSRTRELQDGADRDPEPPSSK